MKIFFYINILSGGGAERVIANLSNQFASQGHEVAVITSFSTEKEYPTVSNVKRLNLEQIEVSGNFIKKNFLRVRSLRKLLKKEKPDIVVSFMAEPNFRTILATRGLKTKTILSVRNDPNREYGNRIYKVLAKCLFENADGIVFQTKDAQVWFSESIQNKSTIIPNQVNPKFFVKSPSENKMNIYSVGRLTEQKNFANLIDAYSLIADEIEDNLIIYGEGELRTSLETKIVELGLEHRISLPGNVTDIEKRICDAKLFVLSSDFEGMPNALMEAMALGLACVSTDCPCGGPKMLLGKNDNGLLVPIQDSVALADAMKTMLIDDSVQREFSQKSLMRAKDFSPENIFGKWEKYVTEILNN